MGGLGALPSRRLAPYFLVGHDRKTPGQGPAVKRYTSCDDRLNTGHSITCFSPNHGPILSPACCKSVFAIRFNFDRLASLSGRNARGSKRQRGLGFSAAGTL